jgi:hypothetical protein
MAIVTTNLEAWYDSTNSASNTGSGTTLYDLSGNSRNATINNPVRVSNYFEMENTTTNKSIDIGTNFSSFMSGSSCQFTIEMWMWVDSAAVNNTGRYRTYVANTSAISTGFTFAGERPTSSGGVQTNIGMYFISPYYQWTPGNLNSGSWIQYTFVNDGADRRIYQNGTLQFTTTLGNSNIAAGDDNLRFAGVSEGYYGWDGKFAIGRIYSKALTAGEILQNYNSDLFNINKITSFDFSDSNTYSGSGSTVYDLTYYRNNGTISGATYTGTGTSKSFSFTGLDDSIYSGIGLSPNTSYSVWTENIWFKAGSGNSNSVIASYGNSTGTESRLIVSNSSINSGNLSFSNRTGSDTLDLGINPTINDWYNVILVGTGSSVLGYVDGVYAGASASNEALGIPRTFALSGSNNGTQTPISGFFNGNIALFEVYNTSITGTAVTTLYNSQKDRFYNPPPPSGKFIDYDITDPLCYPGTGNTIYDLSGYNNDLTIVGTPTFTNPAGQFNLEFNGPSGSGEGAYGFAFTGLTAGNIFTRSYWFQLNSTSASQYISSLGYYYAPSYAVSEDIVDAGGDYTPAWGAGVNPLAGGNLSLNTWYNLVFVADGTDQYLYINGSLVDSDTGTQNKSLTPAEFGFCIGGYIDKYTATPNYNAVALFNGKFAIYQVFDSALDGAAVLSLYNSYASRFAAPPVPYIGQVGGRTFGQGFAG